VNKLDFFDRVAVITGAGKGISRACAIAFARLGAKVVLNSRSKPPLEETLAVIEKAGGQARIVVGDVSDENIARETVSLAVKEFGRLDFAVNNAGISPWVGNTAECTLENWQQVLNINLTGTWLGMKY
jgi:NAD(P)-dependent dehydrogenase (short-subunit alcohol dehydrogenase family)